MTQLSLIYTAAALVAGFILIRLFNALFRFKNTQNIPLICRSPRKYPHIEPILGLDLLIKTFRLLIQRRAVPGLQERHKKYGSTFLVNSLGQNLFHTSHPENFKAIYETNWADWGNGPARADAMEPFCGRGFLTTDGEEWKRIRDMMLPAFNQSNIVDLTSFSSAWETVLDRLPDDGTTIDFAPLLYDFFLDMSGEFLLGHKLSELSTSGGATSPRADSKNFLRALHASQSWAVVRIVFGVIGQSFPNPKWKADCHTLHSFVDNYVENALKKQEQECKLLEGERSFNKDEGYRSLLECLSKHSSDRYEIRSQIIQCILAMQDTTSTLVSNTIFLLARHPRVWSRLRYEASQMPRDGLTAEALQGMPLLQNVIKEALRVYPVFCTLGRTSLKDTVLPKGGGPDGSDPVFVFANSRVITFFYGLHRQASVFGEDVERFNPDRWNDIAPKTWEYLPFSSGPHSCIGQHKAVIETAYVIARLAQRFVKLESRDDREWAGDWKLVVKNFNGCKVAVSAKTGLEELRAVQTKPFGWKDKA